MIQFSKEELIDLHNACKVTLQAGQFYAKVVKAVSAEDYSMLVKKYVPIVRKLELELLPQVGAPATTAGGDGQ